MINTLTFTGASVASDLKVTVFNPGKDAIFPITSTIIYGDKEAILVDAQFQKQYVQKLIGEIKRLGRNLTTVYISHSDPDFYFGLDEIRRAFPEAKLVSTAQTAYLISASKDDKLDVWGPQLKSDAPSELIIPLAVTALPDIEGHKVAIMTKPDDPAHSFLWIPSLKTILGGISVTVDSHLWMADTKDVGAIEQWIAQIDKMKALHPDKVIPSHFTRPDESPNVLDFVKTYLTSYKEAAQSAATGTLLAKAMEAHYPNLPGRESMEMGAKVFKGEMTWALQSPYPPIGKQAIVNFGGAVFELTYKDNKHMSFVGTEGAFTGATDEVEYTTVEVARNVFMVYWQEPKTETNVVHLQNFNTHQVWTNIANEDTSFIHLSGTITVVE